MIYKTYSFNLDKPDGENKLSYDSDLIDSTKCKVYHPQDDEMKNDCSDGKGVCKYKLVNGQGYELLKDEIDYKISTTEKIIPPTPFEGQGQFHFELVEDGSDNNKIIDIRFSSSVLLSEIVIEMPLDKVIYKVNVSVAQQGIQYPDELTSIGVRFNYVLYKQHDNS